MFTKILKIVLYYLFFGGLFAFFPILDKLFPNYLVYYEIVLDLWIINPLVSLFLSLVICCHDDLVFYLPVICGLSFLTILLIFYDETIFFFLIAYIILSFIGCFIGKYLYDKNQKELY